MNRHSTVFRAVACAAFVAATATCGSDRGESVSADTSSVDAISDLGSPDSTAAVAIGAAGSPERDATVRPGEELLTADGWGRLRIGMTRAEVAAAAGEDATPEAIGGPDPGSCDQFRPRRAPAGLLVMVEEGVLTRISVSRNSDFATPEGIRVGDTGSTVLNVYGSRAIVEPHEYWPSPAKYLTVWRDAASPGERRGIRYEIDAADKVVHIHAGGRSIEYVEGCL